LWVKKKNTQHVVQSCAADGIWKGRERKRRRKGLRLESRWHETPGGEGKKAKSEQPDASTGRPKEAGAASAFPLGRGNLREVFLLARRQLGKGRIGRGMGNGR